MVTFYKSSKAGENLDFHSIMSGYVNAFQFPHKEIPLRTKAEGDTNENPSTYGN